MNWFERVMYKKIPLWFFGLTTISLLVGIFLSAYVTYRLEYLRQVSPPAASILEGTLSSIDSFARTAKSFVSTGVASPQVIAVQFPAGFYVEDQRAQQGYFLISAYDVENSVSTVFLYDLKSLELVKEWVPNIRELLQRVSGSYIPTSEDQPQNFRTQHPILTNDGGLIFSSGEGLLVKLNQNSDIEWHIERHFHHSIEPGLQQNQYISQIIVTDPVRLPNGNEVQPLRNDGYVVFSGDGEILEERSIAQILIDNGHIGLLFGTSWESDRLHLNDAEYIHYTDNFVRRGDIMLSIRHLSTVLLYRPSQNKVVWLKTGPFLNQHDIDYLGNGKFSIFGNDNVRLGDNHRLVYKSSAVYVYDMESDVVTRETDLTNADIAINSSGRLQVLNNGNYFIDDTKRALLLSPEGKVLLYYSHEAGTGVGAMHWSRYLVDISKIDFEKEK